MSLRSGHVSIERYTERWRESFEAERRLLTDALGSLALAIEHVGSTAVPGLCAKPVIDIAVAVSDLATGERCIEPLRALGYEYKGEDGVPGRHFFAKGGREARSHYLHVEALNGLLWRNHILLRDYLRLRPDEAARYGDLKRKLAEQHAENRDAYAAAKSPYIEQLIAAAARTLALDDAGRSYLIVPMSD